MDNMEKNSGKQHEVLESSSIAKKKHRNPVSIVSRKRKGCLNLLDCAYPLLDVRFQMFILLSCFNAIISTLLAVFSWSLAAGFALLLLARCSLKMSLFVSMFVSVSLHMLSFLTRCSCPCFASFAFRLLVDAVLHFGLEWFGFLHCCCFHKGCSPRFQS